MLLIYCTLLAEENIWPMDQTKVPEMKPCFVGVKSKLEMTHLSRGPKRRTREPYKQEGGKKSIITNV